MLKLDARDVAALGAVRPVKRAFRDAYELRGYLRACLLARRLLDDPTLLDEGRRYLERFVRDDPKQRRIYETWSELLTAPVEAIVERLLADDDAGAALRDTAPVFVVIPPDDVRSLERAVA